MPPTSTFATVPLWLILAVLIPLGGYCLQLACNVCGVDAPGLRRSILLSTLVAAAAFFTFDGLGYGLVLGLRDTTHLRFAPGYGYAQWLQEPMYLKWQAMGLVPVLRYLPVVIAICLAGTLYVFLLKDHFRVVMVVFLLQWVLTIVAASVVVFALTNLLGLFRSSPLDPRQQPLATRPGATSSETDQLKQILASYKVQLNPYLEKIQEQLTAFHQRIDPHLEPIKEGAAPYTQHLPVVVQEFLNDGGWIWVLAGLTVTGALGIRSTFKRFTRLLRRRRKRRKKLLKYLEINLDEVSGAFTEPGPHQITVRTFPGRLRLVVMAPAASYVGDLLPEMAESLLDWIRPGLGEVHDADHPRVVVWPRFSSEGRFLDLFGKSVHIPEERGRKTPWVVLAGTTHLGRQRIHLGVGVHLDRPGYMREIRVEKDRWAEVLGVKETEKD